MKKRTIKERLQAVRDLITEPTKWCQHARHRGEAHCLVGAIEVVDKIPFITTDELESGYYSELAKYIAQKRFYGDLERVYEYNDNHSHEDVLKMLDEVIAGAE